MKVREKNMIKMKIVTVICVITLVASHHMKDPMKQEESKCGCCPKPCCCHCVSPQSVRTTTLAPEKTTVTSGTPTTPELECNTTLDICIVMDSRASIGQYDWEVALLFVRDIVDSWSIFGDKGIKVAVVTFTETAIVQWDFGSPVNQNKDDLQKAIDNIELSSENRTVIATALETTFTQVLNTEHDRPGTPNLCIVILTGKDDSDPMEFKEQAMKLKESAIVAVLGVTAEAEMEVLTEIATHGEANVFSVDEVDNLFTLVQDTAKTVCGIYKQPAGKDTFPPARSTIPIDTNEDPDEECFCCCPPPPGLPDIHGCGCHHEY